MLWHDKCGQKGQLKETTFGYEEKIHHLADQMIEIDLNDGIKNNYLKFDEILIALK